jgi:glycine hydroxymethyltransferase
MAEMLFRELVKGRGDYVVGSAGVAALPGQAASKHTADLLRQAGIDASGFRSRPLTREMMLAATHVFGMSEQHLRAMEYDFADLMDKAYLVTEFAADDAIRGEDVVDPIGMGLRAYEETRDMLLSSLPSVLAYIEQTTQPKADATSES